MYDVVADTPKDVFILYAVVMLSIVITYPIIRVLISAIGGAIHKWR